MGRGRGKSNESNMCKCLILPCFRHRSSAAAASSSPSCSAEDNGSIVRYSYMTLHNAAQGFRSGCKIGEGGFGSVYKGKLGNGMVVAIKVLSPKSVQGEREFLAEIESMQGTRHGNLLRLRGYCMEGINRILVYDYMERNSLAQNLLSGRHCDVNFTWAARRKISIGIASGLAYLHEVVKPHIIHRDIKPSNILLDSSLTPKISDFGLAKLFPDNITHVSTRVAGTIGYLAPEYARCGRLTRKSDVYSFGVLLLEIISRRSPTNHALGLEFNVVAKAWELYKGDQLLSLVDPSISHECNKEVDQFLRVALLCVQEMPNLRPTMSSVVEMLVTVMDTRSLVISRPGFVSDLRSLKVSQTPPRESGSSSQSKHSSEASLQSSN